MSTTIFGKFMKTIINSQMLLNARKYSKMLAFNFY